MARPRKKKRAHQPIKETTNGAGTRAGAKPPQSMVIRMGAGDVGASMSQLAHDFRAMMEPDTASRLKERKANKLKDYTTMAGPLGVTHFFLFSRSKSGYNNLRFTRTPHGPTLHFQIEKYSLCKDIAKAQKHPRGGGKEYTTAPLLVMNNFTTQTSEATPDPVKKNVEALATIMFQSMFPPISPQTTPLTSIKRILLVNRELGQEGTYIYSIRHYAITTKSTGVSKRVRRFDAAEQRLREKKGHALPNLGKLDDVADYILDPASGGYTSASETELDTDAEVEVLETTAKKVLNRKELEKMRDNELLTPRIREKRNNVEKKAVKLVELGPRLRLRMVRVEEGLCDGRVMWNEYVTKTKGEEAKMDQLWKEKRKLKEERRREQKENVEKKKQMRQNTKANAGNNDIEMDNDEDELEEWDSEELDDEDEGVELGDREDNNAE